MGWDDAPYGKCKKHDLPLEVLFNIAKCPLCEDQRREKQKNEEHGLDGMKMFNCSGDCLSCEYLRFCDEANQ